MEFSINMFAVLASTFVAFIIGGLWYGPLFGKPWLKLLGWSQEKIDGMKKKGGMGKAYAMQFVNSFVMAYVLAHVLEFAKTDSLVMGLQGAFWCWLGFIATTFMGKVLWEGKPWKLYFIDTGHYLVNLLVMGAILALWR